MKSAIFVFYFDIWKKLRQVRDILRQVECLAYYDQFCCFFTKIILFLCITAYNTRETWSWMDFWQKSMVFYGSQSIFQSHNLSNFDSVWVVTKIWYKWKLFVCLRSLMSHYFSAENWFTCPRECPSILTYVIYYCFLCICYVLQM